MIIIAFNNYWQLLIIDHCFKHLLGTKLFDLHPIRGILFLLFPLSRKGKEIVQRLISAQCQTKRKTVIKLE
jgi:hypothetical protein